MRIAIAGGTGTVGRHVVDTSTDRGHDTVVLSRWAGIDLTDGIGLEAALAGVDTVIDVTSVRTRSATASVEFFRAVTTNLLTAGTRAGVGHHIALSVVGSDRARWGYYVGKVVQEELVEHGPVPWSLLRSTHLHESAAQIHDRRGSGPVHLVPAMTSQPVAALEVAQRLVERAESGPAGRLRDLAGPDVLHVAGMVRAYSRATGGKRPVLAFPLPGRLGRALRDGTLTAAPDADRGVQTFAQWISEVAADGPDRDRPRRLLRRRRPTGRGPTWEPSSRPT